MFCRQMRGCAHKKLININFFLVGSFHFIWFFRFIIKLVGAHPNCISTSNEITWDVYSVHCTHTSTLTRYFRFDTINFFVARMILFLLLFCRFVCQQTEQMKNIEMFWLEMLINFAISVTRLLRDFRMENLSIDRFVTTSIRVTEFKMKQSVYNTLLFFIDLLWTWSRFFAHKRCFSLKC